MNAMRACRLRSLHLDETLSPPNMVRVCRPGGRVAEPQPTGKSGMDAPGWDIYVDASKPFQDGTRMSRPVVKDLGMSNYYDNVAERSR